MKKIKVFLLGVLIVLPIVGIVVLEIMYPGNKNIRGICSGVGFVWECIVLLAWYIERKRKKK